VWQRIKNIYHLGNAFLANVWFGYPSRHLTVIGVTGTDGKTTIVSLIYHILKEAGCNVSMVSSVGAVIGEKNYDVGFHVTTPSPWALQRFVKKASLCHPVILNSSFDRLRMVSLPNPFQDPSHNEIPKSIRQAQDPEFIEGQVRNDKKRVRHDNRSRYLVLETTSHALDQYRVWGIKFDIGVLTNVTHEHLDYHKTYKNYVKTKMKLLQKSKVSVINKDDASYKLISSKLKAQNSKLQLKIQKLITYGMRTNADVNPQKFPFKTNLIGEFNRYNVLAAVAACRELGINDQIIKEAILTFTPPIGREEFVHPSAGSGQVDFTVMIDFAHTPNAFEQILSAIKSSIKGRLIHVFGSAGERDATKRPLMGNASSKYSDVIVLTAEDPRSESVEKIMEEIVIGIDDRRWKVEDGGRRLKIENRIFKIADRQEAINAAIGMARKGDFVLITGKSHEKSMNYGKGEEPWDEFGAVRKALRNISERLPRRSRFATPPRWRGNDLDSSEVNF
jgi:UDP-N-acetylmuramoyl-L-alanyl-D-glutamate--2,6-diaminopimelate ligase